MLLKLYILFLSLKLVFLTIGIIEQQNRLLLQMFSGLERRKTSAAGSDPRAGFAFIRSLNKRPNEVSHRLNYPGWIQNFGEDGLGLKGGGVTL